MPHARRVSPGRRTLIACVLGGALAVGSCSDSGNDPEPVASVVVSAPSLSLNVGATVQLTAIARNASGTALSGRTFTWRSDAPSVATVDGNGVVTGVAPGSAMITAASEGQEGSITLTVRTPAALPTVVTLPATNVTESSVVINGTVNPNGAPTTWNFELGLTTSLGERCSGDDTPIDGTEPVPVSCSITGQPAGRTIHYRVIAENSEGSAQGDILSVTTAGGSSSGTAPTITAVSYPATSGTTAGTRTTGTVSFTDPDGDVTHAYFVSSAPNILSNFDFATSVAGQTSGTFEFNTFCTPPSGQTSCVTGTVTVSVTLEDATGKRSAPMNFTTTFQ